MLYLQIAVLGTALRWINIQLISGYTLILQQWLTHAGHLSGGKLSMSRTPAEALGTDQDTGQTWWCFEHQWPGISLLSIIMLFHAERLIIWHGPHWNNFGVERGPVLELCICCADVVVWVCEVRCKPDFVYYRLNSSLNLMFDKSCSNPLWSTRYNTVDRILYKDYKYYQSICNEKIQLLSKDSWKEALKQLSFLHHN